MKISLRWLCDHIADLSWTAIDVHELTKQFNAKVAEIEHVAHIKRDITHIHAVRVSSSVNGCVATLASGAVYQLPARTDLVLPLHDNAACLVTIEGDRCRWVTLSEMGLDKEGLLPPLHIVSADLAGAWRAQWESEDCILDVDNKSLTHRPDMWGHRGFAREVAFLLGKQLRPAAGMLHSFPVIHSTEPAVRNELAQCGVRNDAPVACNGLAAVKIHDVASVACDVRAASRLIAIEYRPRSAAIDMTNYAMADWGSPLHAYDADHIAQGLLRVRFAHNGETLLLLDGSTATLDSNDMVVVDGNDTIVCLAGIMGGKHDSVQADTHSILLCSEWFHASTVRRSGARHKLRTEGSQRHEKTLDNQQLVFALERCASLAIQWGVCTPESIVGGVCSRPAYTPKQLFVSHQYLIDRIGVEIAPEKICSMLGHIDFEVCPEQQDGVAGYAIQIPSFRATKDVSGPHDIVEEVARLYGYEHIPAVLPSVMQRATDIEPVLRERKIKQYLAGVGLQEQRNYAFYNEQVLSLLGWNEAEGVSLQNPVSQEARRLVTSLVPHLLGNVADNMPDVEKCAFFEWGTVWPAGVESERKDLAAVWYDKRGAFDFYDLKQEVTSLFRLASLPVSWHLPEADMIPLWAAPSPIACLKNGEKVIGYFGLVHPVMLQKMGGLPESKAYVFVCNASLLQNTPAPRYTVSNLSKYQHSTVDVSVLVSKSTFVATLESLIKNADPLVEQVVLIDFFEKKEWTDSRSVAFRVTLSSQERTVTKEEVEKVRVHIIQLLTAHGAQLRE